MLHSSRHCQRNFEDYGMLSGKEYDVEVKDDIELSNWFCGKSDDIEGDGYLEAKGVISIPKGTHLSISSDSGFRIVKIKFKGKYQISERNTNARKYNRVKVLQSSDYTSVFEIHAAGGNGKGKDFGKSIIRSDSSIIIPGGMFWTLFHAGNIEKKISISCSEHGVLDFKKRAVNVLDSK